LMGGPSEVGGVDPAGVGDEGAAQKAELVFKFGLPGSEFRGQGHGPMLIRISARRGVRIPSYRSNN
jgi:hypothetical protein